MKRILLALAVLAVSAGSALGLGNFTAKGPGIAWSPMECDSFSPGSSERWMCYDRSAEQLQKWNGSAWVSVESSGAGLSLDGAYDNGYSISVDGTDLTFSLPAAGSSVDINGADGITNTDGLIFSGAGTWVITDAIDASASQIVNALNAGANDITATNWSITGSSGNITTTGTVTSSGSGGLTFANSESLNTDTDAAFDFTRNDAGTVTLTSSDNNSTADLTVDPGGNAILTLGSASDTVTVAATTGIGFSNSETISNGTDGTILLKRNDAGTVTLTANDDDTTTVFTVTSAGAAALNLDAGGAAAINVGPTNATSVSICNTAACDTITIGSNADADTITIGDSTDTNVSITDDNWGVTVAGVETMVSTTFTGAAGITLQNAETIKNGTDGSFTLGRNDAGTVTLTSTDNDATAALTVDPGGNAALTLGSASDTVSVAATAGVSFSNAESISNGTDGTITLGRNDSGTVTVVAADDNATAALSITSGGAATCDLDTGGAAALGLGNANATSISACNSAACDTINLGTNTDADTINIGEVNDTTAIFGANIRNKNGTTFTTADPNPSKASLQAAHFYLVDTTANVVDLDFADDAAMDAADIGSEWVFVVSAGGTNALTVTAGAGGVTTVATLAAAAGSSCEDVGDMIRCTLYATTKLACVSYCAD